MIGSVTEAQQQFAGLEKRRQAITGQAGEAGVPAAVAEPRAASVMPVAGYTAKCADPDIGKGRKKGKDRLPTGAVAEDEGYLAAIAERDAVAEQDAADDAEAAKSTVAQEGPGRFTEPGQLEPAHFDRGYIAVGHASEPPLHGEPRANPLPGLVRYLPPSEPMAARIHPAVIANYTSGSPSDR